MTTEQPDISKLENAITRLEEGLSAWQADTSNTLSRDGVVQRFEFTYELAHKTLKRFLEFVSPSPEQYDQMNFQDLIRSANEQGLLLGDWPAWKTYRDMRSRTSHTYDEEIALAVLSGIPKFLKEARYLHQKLQERLA